MMIKISKSARQVIQIAVVSTILAAIPASGVFAQTATPTPTTQAASPANATPATTPAPRPGPKGGPGGPKGGDPMTRAQKTVDQVKTDLGTAQGKMDVSTAQGWVSQASSLLQAAQSDQSAGKTARAREEAGASQELAMGADELMVAKLGSQLPSQANRPTPPTPPSGQTTVSPQARVSRDLAHSYQSIVNDRDQINAAKLGDPWPGVLSQAEALYKDAYNSYQSQNYDQTSADARVIDHLTHAIDHALHVSSDPTQPVSVPAPQF